MADEKLQYIYLMQAVDPAKAASRDNWAPEDEETFRLHWANLEHLRDAGVLILAGRAQDADGTGPAICILEVDSEEGGAAHLRVGAVLHTRLRDRAPSPLPHRHLKERSMSAAGEEFRQ